ncbi:MAG: hypothetical protein Q9190_007337 [Brigantiaea leucoxantha]
MNRPDLGSTFTKISLWRQTQYRKIVYMDADVVALRAPDELFDQQSSFAAVPDVGWPDCFNSGVMVLNPDMGTYYSLLAYAQRGISFDGADQGLLNTQFRDWHRLSFTYNCTPSGNYQYVPAYRHFQSSINLIHYIGNDKPWIIGRESRSSSGVYEELLGRWWAVYDKHYRESSANISGRTLPAPRTVQQYVKGEASTSTYGFFSVSEPARAEEKPEAQIETSEKPIQQGDRQPAPTIQQRRFSTDWDPIHSAPPANSRPEALDFRTGTYEMSMDRKLFQPPSSYPDPPKNMYYEVPPALTTPEQPKPIFPWEENMTKPARVFPDDRITTSSESAPSATTDDNTPGGKASPSTPITPASTSEPFATFSRTNVWDNMPEIERYVANLPQNRRAKVQVLYQSQAIDSESVLSPGAEVPGSGLHDRRSSMKLTDFPSEIERPSLPVTPAPVRRPSFWGEERNESGDLPAAEGVPDQSDWDPLSKLAELQQHQSEVLAAGPSSPGKALPERSMPGSAAPLPTFEERVTSPAVVPEVTETRPEETTVQTKETAVT